MRKLYISGPITGTTGYVPRFAEAERYIRSQARYRDYEIVNPVNIGLEVERRYVGSPPPHSAYMKACLAELLTCHAIYLLDGWERSDGACAELSAAKACGLEAFLDERG